MTEKDLDIAIEKCERIMEFDTRTLKDPESENGWIFDKVYDLLKFLRKLQFEGSTKDNTNDTISRQAVIAEFSSCNLTPDGGIDANYAIDFLKQMPSAQPGCEDTVPRTSVEYICRKNTVSTNPYEHKYHDKFIQFMDDPEISDFGRWQYSNGFNTALVAVRCDLDKVPSVTPKQPEWIPCSERLPEPGKYYLITRQIFGWNCTEYREIDIAKYDVDGWHKATTVLAWRELPKPWEGEEHAEGSL